MRLLKQPYTSSYLLHPRSLYSSNNYITVISRIFRTTVNPLLIRHTFRALCPFAPRSSCCASCLGRCETAETVGLALWSRITFAVGWVRVMVTHTCKIYTTTYHARTQSKVYISRAQCIASPESKHIDERNAIWVPGWWCLRIHFGSNNNYQSKKYISRRVPCAVMVFARICRCLNAAAPDAWPMRVRTPSPFNIICALPCICWELTVNTRITLCFPLMQRTQMRLHKRERFGASVCAKVLHVQSNNNVDPKKPCCATLKMERYRIESISRNMRCIDSTCDKCVFFTRWPFEGADALYSLRANWRYSVDRNIKI